MTGPTGGTDEPAGGDAGAGQAEAFADPPDLNDSFLDARPDPRDDIDDDIDGPGPDGTDDDIARIALAGARGTSRSNGGRRGNARRRRRPDEAGRNRGGYSAPGPDPARDPQRLGALLPGYVADLGWEQPMADARVFARWADLVGADVAAHCEPQSLRDGELRITAESTAWATQLRLLAGTLLARLVAELGPRVVTKLVISGPTAPSWKHGPRSVRNARGPRDTYG
jgi:predicted nucleic acid-binding Zn ribbon protein